MIDMRVCRRLMPFGEHRSMAEVVETEELARRRRARIPMDSPAAKRLQSLQSRATEPDRDPPPAAA